MSDGSETVPIGDLADGVFRAIVDGTAYPYVVLSPEGIIRFASSSIDAVLGYDPDAIRGRSMAEFLHPDDLELALAAMAEITEHDRSGAGVPIVFRIFGADGRVTWMEIGAMPLLDMPGVGGVVMRLRPWDSQHFFDVFLDAILDGSDLSVVIDALMHAIVPALDATGAAVHYGFDGEGFAGTDGVSVPPSLATARGPWRESARSGAGQFVPTAELDAQLAEESRAMGLTACWTEPIPPSEDLPPAVLSVWRADPGPPLIGHRHELRRSARFVQLALVRWAEFQRLRHLAGHDALTGVANRLMFRERLAQALAIGERNIGVAFCDVDGFKAVNDNFGHREGDAVLIEIVDRLRQALRTGDELARIGGDEFTVLMRNIVDERGASQVAERLLMSVAPPLTSTGREISIGLSIGLALSRPGDTADAILARADQALYQAKRSGGGRSRFAE